MDIQFNADASTTKDALNDFMTEVSDIEDQFGETDVTDQLASDSVFQRSIKEEIEDQLIRKKRY